MRPPPLLLVVAAESGAGKTTLLERLIPALAAHNVRAAAVKLTHHDVDPDPAGKDSRRLRDAGAVASVLGGPSVTSLFVPRRLDVRALAALAAAGGDVDLVLVEGGRDDPDLPRVEVVPPGGTVRSHPRTLLAVATDGGACAGVPHVARDDTAGLARIVLDWLGRSTGGTGD